MASPPPTLASAEPSAEELEARYLAYRRNQAALLAKVLPREAIRPLYRRAREAVSSPPGDPLALLVALCEELLPLPPFDVWKADLRAFPEGHLRDLDEWAEAPAADRPTTLAVRRFVAGDAVWSAHLRAYRISGAWRAFIDFEHPTSGVYRTGSIFREGGPAELEERFSSFDDGSLGAFLRSALP